jgi:hypothetical protein
LKSQKKNASFKIENLSPETSLHEQMNITNNNIKENFECNNDMFKASEFVLSTQNVLDFTRDGVLVVRSEKIWTQNELNLLLKSIDLMDNWPDSPGKFMKYYEDILVEQTGEEKAEVQAKVTKKKVLQRIENFVQYNPGLDFICNGDKLVKSCSQLFQEKALLYKEKVNYKLPGGAGFAPHQDVAAGWKMYGQSLHISVLVCIDQATLENGCLEVAFGEHRRGMLSEPWKELSHDVCQKLKFEPIQTHPGDVIFFDSYVPHQSQPNRTSKPRRVLYATYAKANEGDFRDQYYKDKRVSFPPDCERDPNKKYEYKV